MPYGRAKRRGSSVASYILWKILAEVFRHEHAVVPGFLPATGLLESEPAVQRDVLDHLLLGVQPQLAIPEPPRFSLGEFDQPPPEPLALPLRTHRDVVEQQMIGLRQQHDDRGDRVIVGVKYAYSPLGDQRAVIVEH